jgi:hypothetical protein
VIGGPVDQTHGRAVAAPRVALRCVPRFNPPVTDDSEADFAHPVDEVLSWHLPSVDAQTNGPMPKRLSNGFFPALPKLN